MLVKKSVVFLAVGLVLISCKKERTCLCQLKTSNQNGGYTETFTEYEINDTKAKAESECLVIQAELESSTSASVKCGLKF